MFEIPHEGRGVQVGDGRNRQPAQHFANCNKSGVRGFLDRIFVLGLRSDGMSSPVVVAANPPSHQATCWLALALTPGLGPTRVKKLVEHFGSPERVFQASLTELEATGMQAVSAQALATGKSSELAQQECMKASECHARIVALSDPEYPPRLKEIYDPPVVLFVRGNMEVLSHARHRGGGNAASDALRHRHGGASGGRPGGARPGHHQRHGARCGHCCPSRRPRRQGQNRGRVRHRN